MPREANLRIWFGVHTILFDDGPLSTRTSERLEVEPVDMIIEDFGLINWLKDYRLGNLDV